MPTNETKARSDGCWFGHVATCVLRGHLHCPARVLQVSRPRRLLSSACPHDIAISLDTIDLLLLDEPTNHLDLEGVVWLSKQLTGGIGDTMVLMVSHDAAFIDAVVTDVIHFQLKQLSYYAGDYSAFMKVWGRMIWWSTCRPLSRVVVRYLSQFFVVVSRPVLSVGVALTAASAFARVSLSALLKTQFYDMTQRCLLSLLRHRTVFVDWSFGSYSNLSRHFFSAPPPVQLYSCRPRHFEAQSGVRGDVDDAIQYVRSLQRSIDLSRLLLFSTTFVCLAAIWF